MPTDLSTFLAQIFGLYFVVAGLAIFARQKTLTFVVKDMVKSPAVMWLAGVFAFVLGLVVVLTHNVWEASWRVILTILGWLMLAEGVTYLFLPHKTLKKLAKFFNRQYWIYLGSLVSILLGAYLLYIGFLV